MNDRLVWIDCEMTGLDYVADALIEVAALVTDFDLNVLGDGVDLVIKPPAEALDQMDDFVRDDARAVRPARRARRRRSPRGGRAAGARLRPGALPGRRRPPLAGNTVGTDRAFLARDMTDARRASCTTGSSTSPRSRSCPPLVPPRLLRRAGQARQPPRARRHPGEHRGAALLPGRDLRALARARQRRGARPLAQEHGGSLTGAHGRPPRCGAPTG